MRALAPQQRIGALRLQHDDSAALGVPAHLTILFPFLAPAHQGLLQGHGGTNTPTTPVIPIPQ